MKDRDIRQDDLEERIKKASECDHKGPPRLIPAMEQCPKCGVMWEAPIKVPDEEVQDIKDRDYDPVKIVKLKPSEVAALWRAWISSGLLRDNSTMEGHLSALEDFRRAEDMELQMARIRENLENMTRKTWAGDRHDVKQ